MGWGDEALDVVFQAATAGDEQAWNEMVERLSPAIWSVCSSFGFGSSESEDLAQTVWLRLVDKWSSIAEPRAVPGWIQTTARNEAIAMARRSGREIPEALDEQHDQTPSDRPDPGDTVVDRDELDLVLEALRSIDERCQQLLRLIANRILYADIATLLDMAVGSIGPTLRRCLDKLRATPELRSLLDDAPDGASDDDADEEE